MAPNTRHFRHSASGCTIRTDLRVGDLGRLIVIHGEVYDDLPGYGVAFEAYVARTVSEFFIDNQARGCVWLAEKAGVLAGCIAIAERSERRAQLRWLVVRPKFRGTGLGRHLVDASLAYCVDRGFETVFLETTDGLDASMQMYEKRGFTVVRETTEPLWSGDRRLIVMEKRL